MITQPVCVGLAAVVAVFALGWVFYTYLVWRDAGLWPFHGDVAVWLWFGVFIVFSPYLSQGVLLFAVIVVPGVFKRDVGIYAAGIPSAVRECLSRLSREPMMKVHSTPKLLRWVAPNTWGVVIPDAHLKVLAEAELIAMGCRTVFFRSDRTPAQTQRRWVQAGLIAVACPSFLSFAGTLPQLPAWPLLSSAVAAVLCAIVFDHHLLHRIDLDADIWAAQQTGDAEVYIRTLAKIDRLLRANGRRPGRAFLWCRPASLEERALAVAEAAGIQRERANAMIEAA